MCLTITVLNKVTKVQVLYSLSRHGTMLHNSNIIHRDSFAAGGVVIELCAARHQSGLRDYTSAEPSLLSEVSVVLLAERVKPEFETSAHKPVKTHVSKQGF